jgi:hypothetical protein
MSGARGIAAAGLIAIFVTGARGLYRAWPVTHGIEIYVPAAIFAQPGDLAMVEVRMPFARLELDVPHTTREVGETFEPVRRMGTWWNDGPSKARALAGRALYLQLLAAEPLWPGGPAAMRPSTVSDGVVNGAINLEGMVSRASESGYIWLDFPFGWIGVPRSVVSHARPFVPPGARTNTRGSIPPASDPGVFAVLRVLPSGRAALTGVIVNGTRY